MKKAFELRQKLLSLVLQNGGHLSTEVFGYYGWLYIMVKVLKFKAFEPNWLHRDRFIISKGHAETITYLILKELVSFQKICYENIIEKENLN